MYLPVDHPNPISYGFSTMGCPDISFPGLLGLAREFDMDFVELRALGNTTDLPKYFVENPFSTEPGLKQVPVRLVATNLCLSEATPDDIIDFRRYVDVAITLQAPYVRVFGGGRWGESFSSTQWEHAVRTVEECRRHISEKSESCEMLLETHSGFSSSAMCLQLNGLLADPISVLWDAHHTWRNAGESPTDTWEAIGDLVRHIHFSDSRLKPAPETGHEWVLPGGGEYPVLALKQLLAKVSFSHGVSLEWEKLWHPELPNIQLALAEFKSLFANTKNAPQNLVSNLR